MPAFLLIFSNCLFNFTIRVFLRKICPPNNVFYIIISSAKYFYIIVNLL